MIIAPFCGAYTNDIRTYTWFSVFFLFFIHPPTRRDASGSISDRINILWYYIIFGTLNIVFVYNHCIIFIIFLCVCVCVCVGLSCMRVFVRSNIKILFRYVPMCMLYTHTHTHTPYKRIYVRVNINTYYYIGWYLYVEKLGRNI